MRLSGILFASATALLLAGSALAQQPSGNMGGSMSGGMNKDGAMKGGGMQMNAQGGVGIFSRENMAMMIVDREKATKGMTEDQAKAARQEEMTKDRAESPDLRQARKARYDSEWMQLTGAEKTDALAKLDTQMKARGMMAPAPAAK
ncbi:MAG TPA: hypothetical protein VGI89_06815 [Rhizomicrobium sp.]